MAEDEVGDSRMRVGGWLPPLRPVRPTESDAVPDRPDRAGDPEWRDLVEASPQPGRRRRLGAAHRRTQTPFQDVSLRLFLGAAAALSVLMVVISYTLVRPSDPPRQAIDAGRFPAPTAPTRRWTDGPPWTTAPTAAPTTSMSSPTPERTSHQTSRTAHRPNPAPKPTIVLELRRLAVPSTVDLTALGRSDWVHWGQFGARWVERKDFGTGAILDQGGDPRGQYDNNPERFAWSDGEFNEFERGTSTGVYTCGLGSGFNLAVRNAPGKRTVRLFAGVWMARGRLDVRLSTGGPVRTASVENRFGISTAQFEMTVEAPPGSLLLLRWSSEQVFHPGCGNVDLQAMTLS